ncbi:MAG: UbiX family flavin prenyltransferase [Candidatus Riflebacteria bacterium]|nr:UbiX family flavin prenyltransferase [Candidatus Riflebacteria bacterium]
MGQLHVWASGAPYALRLLQCLHGLELEVHVAVSAAARVTWEWELQESFETSVARLPGLRVHAEHDWMSPIASGSFRHDGMAVVPCSMRTLGAIAAGVSDNLVQRAAEVCLKERRKLVAVVREAPYSLGHLENMLRATRAGAIVLPASPGFYHRPRTVSDLVDFVVSRVLDHLGVPNDLIRRWGPNAVEAQSDAGSTARGQDRELG